jgi:hypothetical protein
MKESYSFHRVGKGQAIRLLLRECRVFGSDNMALAKTTVFRGVRIVAESVY